MRTLRMLLPVAAMVVGVTVSAQEQLLGPASVSELHWLAGCWERRAGDLLIEEQWQAPRAGVMLGLSRTTRGDALVAYEFMQILVRNDTLVFAAQPSGQHPAEFFASSRDQFAMIFENPAHDYPQRVQYFAAGPDSLIGRIDGTRGGELRTVEFRYARVACAQADTSARLPIAPLPADEEIEWFVRAALEDRLAARDFPDKNLFLGDPAPAIRAELVHAGLRLGPNAVPRVAGYEFYLISVADALLEGQRRPNFVFVTVDNPRIQGDTATVWLGVDAFPKGLCCCNAEAHFRRVGGRWAFVRWGRSYCI